MGKQAPLSPAVGLDNRGLVMAGVGSYLKKHTEALVKDVGIEPACELTGKSKATLGRYYSDSDEHADRFMPVDAVAALEAAASYPHVTSALAELRGITMSYDDTTGNSAGGINSDVIMLVRDVDGGIQPIDRGWHYHRQRGQAPVARNHGAAKSTDRNEAAP